MNLQSVRKEYKKAQLADESIAKSPFLLFERWLSEAMNAGISEPTAMSVATIGDDGFPQSRVVLLKDFSKKGFTFFTNYNSAKGKALLYNPRVALLFFWPELERQVRVTGTAQKTTAQVSEEYFQSRPLDSRYAATVSRQSEKIESYRELIDKFKSMKNIGEQPTRPEHWGGFLVVPLKFEFWQGRENRLHDRILYEKTGENWEVSRLAP